MNLVFASDHAGYDLRRTLAEFAKSAGHSVTEVGAPSTEAYDYPDAADEGVRAVLSGEAEFGILICATGIGISIRANRHQGIRAALCTSEHMASLSREHNHANVLCLGGRITDPELAHRIMDVFLDTPESEGERHLRRIQKLDVGC